MKSLDYKIMNHTAIFHLLLSKVSKKLRIEIAERVQHETIQIAFKVDDENEINET